MPSHPINGPRISVSPDTGALIAEGISVHRLIGFAYETELSRITGEPAWLRSKYYEIEAHPPAHADEPSMSGGRIEELRQLVRGLLYDHFGLRAHREQVPLYILEIAPGGPIMPRAAQSAAQQRNIRDDSEGDIIARSVTASDLASILGKRLRRPVLNHTGLRGSYDIELTWEHNTARVTDPQALRTALREQLGLALRWIPMQVLLVDEAHELPDGLGRGHVFEPLPD